MAKVKRDEELKNPTYEVFIGILSILSVVDLFWALLTPFSYIFDVLQVMNGLLTFIFIIDFIMRMLTAESKSQYFWRQAGWADLLACLPFAQTKIFRMFRVVRAYRLIKRFGLTNMIRELVDNRAQSALLTLLLMGILVFQFGSMAMLTVESRSANANIKSASDALWYTIVTISTVGYGDRYPVTNAGRLVGSGIIIIGVGIFGTFTGYLANLFLSGKPKEEAAPEPGEGGSDEVLAPEAGAPEAGSAEKPEETSVEPA